MDFSLGVAQIKPRTALTASVLATGYTPETLLEPARGDYRQVELVGAVWSPPIAGARKLRLRVFLEGQRLMVMFNAKPMVCSVSFKRIGRRAKGGTMSERRSAKTRRGQAA